MQNGWDLSAAIRRSKILGSMADVKPSEINWKALGITCVWGQSPGSLICVPIQLLPQKTTCRCPQERESWLSQPSFLLGYQCFASISECFLPEKCSQLYFFFHWLYWNTVPFFSWRPSWCLPFLWCIPSPPFLMERGCPDTLAQNWFTLGKKNPKTFLWIKNLFSMERLGFIFT